VTRRPGAHDEGFTLLELGVVVTIIGVLATLALPSFLGIRSRADDLVARDALRRTALNARLLYADHQTFAIDEPSFRGVEPGLAYRRAAALPSAQPSGGPVTMVYFGDESVFGAVARSKSGRCFLTAVVGDGQPFVTHMRQTESVTECTLPASLVTPDAPWALVL
jgi:prepilin-type N-terminal cleavage/methylation domain-containing protein